MNLWHGRFRSPLNTTALRFSSSLDVDSRLYKEDIEGSLAHVAMLAKQGIISSRDATRIQRALKQIRKDIDEGRFRFTAGTRRAGRFVAEDVHMAIEQRLIEKVGEIGGKLHTARSRNDQIAVDERLYLRSASATVRKQIRLLQRALIGRAERYKGIIMPGYTHLQRAQPIFLAHHLLAYVEMLERDSGRFDDELKRINRSPLGAGALAGTSFPIDRQRVANALGFNGMVENSMDAVSDRDVQIAFLANCAITMMHLSRLAEELVIWSSTEWSFVELSDAHTTGSSIMPQKKNPDMAELVRGKTGRVYGDLMALLTVMKGLPLAYNRDMQEDKEPLFDAADTTIASLQVMTGMMKTARFNAQRFVEERGNDFLLATELADYLVRKGMPFRKAHAVVGGIVAECVAQKRTLGELSLEDYRGHSKFFASDLFEVLTLSGSLAAKRSAGSTSPREVGRMLRSWKKKLR